MTKELAFPANGKATLRKPHAKEQLFSPALESRSRPITGCDINFYNKNDHFAKS